MRVSHPGIWGIFTVPYFFARKRPAHCSRDASAAVPGWPLTDRGRVASGPQCVLRKREKNYDILRVWIFY
jgi:hypothetical protein